MVTEIELKYSLLEADELTTAKQIQTQVSQLLSDHKLLFIHQEKQLSNHYFDSKSLVLRKNKIALRTRGTRPLGKVQRFEQTMKTSGTVIGGLHQRPEYNIDICDAKPILALFSKDIWPVDMHIEQLQQQIVELFTTNFTRNSWLVSLDDAQVEIAFDCGEVACQGSANKPRIYEIELELVSGEAQALFVLTKILFSQLSLRPGQLTKAARGYALYYQSILPKNDTANKHIHYDNAVAQISLAMIDLPKDSNLDDAFNHGIAYSLTQLQLSVDSYVESPSFNKLNKVGQFLALLRQGFWLFSKLLTTDDLALRDELSYFIRIFHWVDDARYIQSLASKENPYQKESVVSQELIVKLELTQNSYPSESQVLALLHSERFNNLQLSLLNLLLDRSTVDGKKRSNSVSLVEYAAQHLTKNTKAVNIELDNFSKQQISSSTDLYLNVNSLLSSALLTTSWFSCFFSEPTSEQINNFNMPWVDIKQDIIELQSLTLLQTKLIDLPQPEMELEKWLTSKSEYLITKLDNSRKKALTMKPYWP